MNTTALMTLAEFEALPDVPGKQELIKGELVHLPPPQIPHGRVQRRLLLFLNHHVEEHDLGEVFVGIGFKISEDTCLEPDVAFVQRSQRPEAKLDGWFPGAPTLAVEILSPSNRASEIEDKVRIYLENGSHAVWVFNPKRKRLIAYYQGGRYEIIEGPEGEIADDVLFPGLRIPLAALFEGLE